MPCTARKGKRSPLSEPLAKFGRGTEDTSPMFWTATNSGRVCARRWRGQEAIEEAPRRARGDSQRCTECRRFPLRAYTGVHHDRCRPEVGRSVTPSCTQLGRTGSPAPLRVAQVARRLPGRHSSVASSRCAAGLDFLFGAVPREDRHLGALKMVFCPKAHAGHW